MSTNKGNDLMKNKHKILVSSNGWEYSDVVIIEAEKLKVIWDCDEGDKNYYLKNNKKYGEHNEGTAVIADGVKISFNEPLEYHGVIK